MAIQKRLYRSRDDRIIAGVFGGLGEYFEIDPVMLRLAFIVLFVVTGFIPGILIYILAIFVMPPQPLIHADYEQSGTSAEPTKAQPAETTKTESAPSSTPDSPDSAPHTPPIPPSRRDDPLW